MRRRITFARPTAKYDPDKPIVERRGDGAHIRRFEGIFTTESLSVSEGVAFMEMWIEADSDAAAIEKFQSHFPDADEQYIVHIVSEGDPDACQDYYLQKGKAPEKRFCHGSVKPFGPPEERDAERSAADREVDPHIGGDSG